MADFADKKDSECLPKILKQTIDNLKQNEIQIQQICADTGYSSGSGLHFVEENGIDGYIPNHGSYKPIREGFFYNEKLDQWECQRGNMAILKFKNIQTDGNGYKKKKYMSSAMDCRDCPFSESCLSKSYKAKKIEDSIDKPYYD